jgi:hypothetical protein
MSCSMILSITLKAQVFVNVNPNHTTIVLKEKICISLIQRLLEIKWYNQLKFLIFVLTKTIIPIFY